MSTCGLRLSTLMWTISFLFLSLVTAPCYISLASISQGRQSYSDGRRLSLEMAGGSQGNLTETKGYLMTCRFLKRERKWGLLLVSSP